MSTNQCDGCRQGLPISIGLHRNPDGSPFMSCSAERYGSTDDDGYPIVTGEWGVSRGHPHSEHTGPGDDRFYVYRVNRDKYNGYEVQSQTYLTWGVAEAVARTLNSTQENAG